MFWCKSLPMLTLETLRGFQRRAFRNGAWRRLTAFEKAILRASALYAKIMGKIVNRKLVGIILNVADKIQFSRESKIVLLGLNRIAELRSLCLRNNILAWCPQLGSWLAQRSYVLYLGTIATHPPRGYAS
jgi:hypothetical protein